MVTINTKVKTNSLHSFRWLGFSLIALTIATAKADPLDNWTTSQIVTNPPGFMGMQLLGITYGNGKYVAVGQYLEDDDGVIETSNDGLNWTMQTTRDYSILDLYDVIYGAGIFVAVGWDYYGGNNIYSSTNGINWTPHATQISNIHGVTYGEGTFVAVGDGLLLNGTTYTNQNIYVSTDGINWSATDSGVPSGQVHTLYDVAYGAGNFVAVDGAGYFYSSSDGFDWTRTANSRAGQEVSFCNGLFFVPADAGTNLMSRDGLNWSLVTNSTGAAFGHVIYAAGVFVAQGSSKLFSSSDGTNWVQRNFNPPSNVDVTDLSFGNRNVVLTGYAYPASPTFAPAAFISDPFVALNMGASFPPQLTVSGLTNRNYRIEFLTNLASNNWQIATNFTLTNSPFIWTDSQATDSSRFYRAALLP